MSLTSTIIISIAVFLGIVLLLVALLLFVRNKLMPKGKVKITINGEKVPVAGRTIAEYLADKSFPKTGIAVALNDIVVPKSKHGKTVMKDGDRVEIVHCVQGG